jgi:hypothetical protein
MSPQASCSDFRFLSSKGWHTLSQPIIERLSVSPEKAKAISKTQRKPRQARQPAKSAEEGAQEQLPREALARFTLKGTGYVDITDKDTFGIAKAYWKVLSKKLGISEEESE